MRRRITLILLSAVSVLVASAHAAASAATSTDGGSQGVLVRHQAWGRSSYRGVSQGQHGSSTRLTRALLSCRGGGGDANSRAGAACLSAGRKGTVPVRGVGPWGLVSHSQGRESTEVVPRGTNRGWCLSSLS